MANEWLALPGDTCRIKKIRCDMTRPVCSNCMLYKVPCTTTFTRRRVAETLRAKPVSASPSGPPPADGVSTSSQQDSLQARLARVESKLNSLGASSPGLSLLGDQLEKRGGPNFSNRGSNAGAPFSLLANGENRLSYPIPDTATAFPLHEMHEILPAVQAYFRDYNSAIPLFHQASFIKLLQDFHAGPRHSSRVVWGVINCVLAIGYRIGSIDEDPVRKAASVEKSLECVSKAHSVLDDMIMWEEDTLGLQGVLALAIIFQTSPSHKRSSVLISMAVRLAHRLNLHNRSSRLHFSPVDARQRDNVFWICYWLDKDISLRTKTASFQLDSDMDLDLPGSGPVVVEGELCSVDGLSRFNYFRARVQLAHLQGRIYDSLYSVRSKKLTKEERREQVRQLGVMLDEWHQSIPTALQVEHLSQSLAKAAALHMSLLHHHYLICLVSVHGLYSVESGWIKALETFSREVLEQYDRNSEVCMRQMPPPLPAAWDKCVTAARGSVRIFLSEPRSSCSIWLNIWSYFSGLIILLANCEYFPRGEFVMEDRSIAREGVQLLVRTVRAKEDEQLDQVIGILHSLGRVVDAKINYYQANPHKTPDAPRDTVEYGTPPGPPDASSFGFVTLGTDAKGYGTATSDSSADFSAWLDDPALASFDFDFADTESFSFGHRGGSPAPVNGPVLF